MSIEKWISDKDSKEERIKREKAFKQLSKEEVQELKKTKIRDIVKKKEQKISEVSERVKLLHDINEFKKWLNQRTYLKGDIDKIETWIKNMHLKVSEHISGKEDSNSKKKLKEDYKKIPLNFLDEKTRIAINKKINGTTRTNSEYYEILEKILNLL